MTFQGHMSAVIIFLFALSQTSQSVPAGVQGHHTRTKPHDLVIRQVTECILVTSEEGLYEVSATNQDTPCGIYLLSDPDDMIEVSIRRMSVTCEGGTVAVIDGWEMNGEFFPSNEDHELPLEKRFIELCGEQQPRHLLTSHQNAVLIMYQLSKPGDSFSVLVRFRKNPAPCNILTEGANFFTLRNYGARRNCTLVAMYPAEFDVVMLDVGAGRQSAAGIKRTGKMHQRQAPDAVQIGGASGMDVSAMVLADELTGEDSNPRGLEYGIGCGVSSVRLVSSGQVDNAVTVAVKQLDLNDPNAISKIAVMCVRR